MDVKNPIKSILLFTLTVLLFSSCGGQKSNDYTQTGESIFKTHTFKFLTSDNDLLELTQGQVIAFLKSEIGNEPREFDLVHFEILQNPDNPDEYALLGVSENGFVNIVASLEEQDFGFRLTGKTCECKSETAPACEARTWNGECLCAPCDVAGAKTSTIKTFSTSEFRTAS